MQPTTIHSHDFADPAPLEAFERHMSSLGFGRWIFSAASLLHKPSDPNVTRISSYPREFIEHYNSAHFNQLDPSTPYWLSQHKAASYRKVRRSTPLSLRQQQLMDLNKEHDVNRGIVIPLHNVLGFKAVMALSFDGSIAELNSYINAVEDEIFSASLAFNRSFLLRHKSLFLTPSKALLTPRQIKVIALIAQGLQTQQVADSLAISINAVDKHIANIKSSLCAPTTAAAVALALQWQLI